MKIKILSEHGLDEALKGLSLNKHATIDRAEAVSRKLACKGGGHDKFMRQICVWLEIDAPAYWWLHVGFYHFLEQQSESKMHTIMKRDLEQSDFEMPIPHALLDLMNNMRRDGLFNQLLNVLPHGFLQKRVVSTNYAQIATIIQQRKKHKLPEWREFCEVMKGLECFYYLERLY